MKSKTEALTLAVGVAGRHYGLCAAAQEGAHHEQKDGEERNVHLNMQGRQEETGRGNMLAIACVCGSGQSTRQQSVRNANSLISRDTWPW